MPGVVASCSCIPVHSLALAGAWTSRLPAEPLWGAAWSQVARLEMGSPAPSWPLQPQVLPQVSPAPRALSLTA
jgi:hypothetical protein